MATELYQIILLNELQDGTNPDDVHAAFVERFKLKADIANKLLASTQPICIKKDLTIEQAVMYKQAIDDLGANCLIESMQVDITQHNYLDTQSFMTDQQSVVKKRQDDDR